MFLGKRESRSSPNTLETFASSCPWSMFHWTGGDQVNRMLTAVFFPLGQWHVRVHPRLLWRRCWADLCPLQAVSLVLRVQKLATSLLTKTWFFFTFLFSVVPLACEDEPGEILSSTAIAGDEEGDVRRSHSLLPVSKTLNSITPIFAMILRSINLFTLSFHSLLFVHYFSHRPSRWRSLVARYIAGVVRWVLATKSPRGARCSKSARTRWVSMVCFVLKNSFNANCGFSFGVF